MSCLPYDGHIHCWHCKKVAHIEINQCCRCNKEESKSCNYPTYPWYPQYPYYDPCPQPSPIWVTTTDTTAGGGYHL